MIETAKNQADRKSLHNTGIMMRLSGMGLIGYELLQTVTQSIPMSKLEVYGHAGALTLGFCAATKWSSACINSAKNAANYVAEAKYGLKFPYIRATAAFLASTMLVSSFSEKAGEIKQNQFYMEGNPLARASGSRLKNVIFKDDMSCPKGRSVATFDKETNITTITRCMAPAAP